MSVLKNYEVTTASGSLTLLATCDEMARLEVTDRGLEVLDVREVPYGT